MLFRSNPKAKAAALHVVVLHVGIATGAQHFGFIPKHNRLGLDVAAPYELSRIFGRAPQS
jgi:hypothetical protein